MVRVSVEGPVSGSRVTKNIFICGQVSSVTRKVKHSCTGVGWPKGEGGFATVFWAASQSAARSRREVENMDSMVE